MTSPHPLPRHEFSADCRNWGGQHPRHLLAAAVIAIAIAGCSSGGKTAAPTTVPPTTAATSRSPVAVAALDGLLLSPAEINTAVGTTGIPVKGTYTQMLDASAEVPDKDCRFTDQSAEASVYAGSGWTAVRRQQLQEPGDNFTHAVDQAVVSFPSANDAARFFTASAQRWPACSNRQYHAVRPGRPDWVWTVGPITNTNGTLSSIETLEGGNGWACQRALTVTNNIAIDALVCSANTPAGAAVNIAHQIAAKVAKL
jgi:serine/threonine kinase PknH